MATIASNQVLDSLIQHMDRAVEECACSKTTCEAVKVTLETTINGRVSFLPASAVHPDPDTYARHLVHRDPQGRYSVIAMVWAPGQGTPIHDHGGLWVVECVYEGRVEVLAYDLTPTPTPNVVRFEEATRVVAGCGEAGSLIPPRDHHVIHNPFDTVAVTLHVYGGDLDRCDVFTGQGDGTYLREAKELSLS